MSAAKFTPGPWVVKNLRWITATRGECTGEILIAPTFWLAHLPEEQEANATLIAAAPDMFAACGQASFALRELLPDHPDAQMTVRMLKAAIARATGAAQ